MDILNLMFFLKTILLHKILPILSIIIGALLIFLGWGDWRDLIPSKMGIKMVILIAIIIQWTGMFLLILGAGFLTDNYL